MEQIIPRIIHLIFLNKNEKHPDVFVQCISIIKKMHPDWEIRIYDEDDANNIIDQFFPYLKPVYNSYSHTVQKADILRIILVYLFGGFYMDMDMLCLKPLDSLLHYKLVLGIEESISPAKAKKHNLKSPIRIANYMFGSVPYHSFWLINLKEAVKLSITKIKSENDILESTGPGLLSDLIRKYKSEYPEMILLNNRDRVCLSKWHNKVTCYFGNYAAHLHSGSWRWGVSHISSDQNYDKVLNTPKHISSAVENIEKNFKPNAHKVYKLEIIFDKTKHSKPTLTLIRSLNNIKISKRVRLICDLNLLNQRKLNNEFINIFYCESELDISSQKKIINISFAACIVLTEYAKEYFTKHGITVPIFVIKPGFLRLKRNFYSEIDIKTFNIGCIMNKTASFISNLIVACEQLQARQIPNLQLMLLGNTDELSSITKTKKEKYLTISKKKASENRLSNWYNRLHINISICQNNQFPFEALQSLYLGIPTLINSSPATNFFISTGYYNVLDIHENQEAVRPAVPDIEQIKQAILKIHQNFDKQQQKAADGAAWIEELWSMEDCRNQILNIIDLI